jgi:hypothetical protein
MPIPKFVRGVSIIQIQKYTFGLYGAIRNAFDAGKSIPSAIGKGLARCNGFAPHQNH